MSRCAMVGAMFFALTLMTTCATPTPTATPMPTVTETYTPAPTSAPTVTLTLTSTATPTVMATFTPAPTATPTQCLVEHIVTATPGIRLVEISSKELAMQLPKSINQQGISLKEISTAIHSDGIDFQARVELTGVGILTATATMFARAEEGAVFLLPEDIKIEEAPDATTQSVATLLFQRLLEDPQWIRVSLPYGHAYCVELREGYMRLAVLWHTPTPTHTSIPPKALATMFPSNPIYGLRSLARAGAAITPQASHDRETNLLLGLDGTISFPTDYRGSVHNLLLETLDPLLTNGMVLRDKREGLEEYCSCTMGVKLGDLTADICWCAGQYPDGTYGRIFTRLGIINPRVSPQFYQILSDVERLRGR